jgi:hypothetical protein
VSRTTVRNAVRYLAAERGIRQFLDIGTGLPTADNTHDAAQAIAPGSRIVYVDNNPLVLVHAHALLTSSPEGATAYIDADLREPDKILADDDLLGTLDLSQPVALMLVAISCTSSRPRTTTRTGSSRDWSAHSPRVAASSQATQRRTLLV